MGPLSAGFRVLGAALLGLLALDVGVRVLGDVGPVVLVAPPTAESSRAALDARLDAFFDSAGAAPSTSSSTVFLGDSVVRGAHLTDAAARLPARFAEASGAPVLDLSVDGLLFSSLDCYVAAVVARRPDTLILDVSPRPLSADFAATEPCVACEPAEARPMRWLRAHSSLLGGRAALQTAALGGSPKSLVLDALDARLRPADHDRMSEGPAETPEDPEEAEILARMAQVLKAAARLRTVEVSPERPQLAALDALLTRLARVDLRRVVVFSLEENLDALAPQLDPAPYRAARAAFVDRVRTGLTGAANLRFVDLPAADFAGHYVDHVHLDAAGYARLAERLAEAAR